MTNWKAQKEALLHELTVYFMRQGLGKTSSTLRQIRNRVEFWTQICIEAGKPMQIGKDEDLLKDEFSPQHRKFLLEIINKNYELEKQAFVYLEAQRPKCWARDDFEYEEWEKSQPPGEVVIYSDHIEVTSFEYNEYFLKCLPKRGKERIGKTGNGGYKWKYPLTEKEALENIKGMKLPVYYAIDAIDAKETV